MSDAEAATLELNEQLETMAPRPWVRYWARMFDVYFFSLIFGLVSEFVSPGVLEHMNDAALGLAVLFVWVFVESFLLCTWGTTPGKALLRIRIKKSDGAPIQISDALARSFRVWWRGTAIGVPLIALITLTFAYHKLQTDRITTWDRDTGIVVTHGDIGWVRVIALVLFFLMFLGLTIVGSVQGA